MKHTKNMIIRETTESRELALFIENDGQLYHDAIQPTIKHLAKKYAAGNYSAALATDLYYRAVAIPGALKYCIVYARLEDAPNVFDVTSRYTAAADLESFFLDEVVETAEAIKEEKA